MDFSNFGRQLVYDSVLRRGVPGVVGTVVDMVTGERLKTYRLDGTPAPLVSDALGYTPQFKVAGEVPLVELTFGQIEMVVNSFQAVLAASVAAENARQDAAASALSAWQAANLVEAPADGVIATVIAAIGSATRTQLDTLYGSLATIVKAGLMSAEDKEMLDGVPEDLTAIGAALEGKAPTSHTHTEIKRGAHLLDLTQNGWLDHIVNGAIVWEVDPTGKLTKGIIPRARLEAPVTLAAGSNLDTIQAPGQYHANNAAAAGSTNFPVPFAGHLEVAADASGGMVYQRYQVYATASADTKGRVYTRAWYSGSWSSWETPLIDRGLHAGVVAITPTAANTPTAYNLTFPVGKFAVAPTVVPGINGAAPGTVVTGVGVTSITTGGCTLWVTRTNTTTTTVSFFAYGG